MTYCHLISYSSMHSHVQRGNEKPKQRENLWRQTMRKIHYLYVLVILMLGSLLTSCGSPYRTVHPSEVIENKDISFVVPDTRFEIDKEYSSPKENIHNRQLYLIDFNRKGLKFKIYTMKYYKWKGNGKYFKKNSRFDDSDIREEVFTKRDREENTTYKKTWIAYVKGMKCQGFVFSRGFGGSYAPFTRKSYSLSCGYYDKTETQNNGKRFIRIEYSYTADPKHNYEQELKDTVKKVIATLKIKNMDTARMKREGLLYPHRRFKSTKW